MTTLLVLGTGVAGLTTALAAADAGAQVVLVTPGSFDERTGQASTLAGGNTAWAQGGIAAAIGSGDSPQLHTADTIAAGAGLVDAEAARMLTEQGASEVLKLIGAGFEIDRDPITGMPSLGLEGAHLRPRIVHAGEDRTGASLHAYLSARLLKARLTGQIDLVERSSAVSLLVDADAVVGAVLRDETGQLSAVRADATVIATGGYGAIYAQSTNHSGAQGEGVLLAARAGALIADLEFVQFHPTVLEGTGLLISEAVRGAGAVLRDRRGVAFMAGEHEAADLAPRDVVARAIHRQLRAHGAASVLLDATVIEREQGAGTLAKRFPKLTELTRAQGFDWAREPIPVAPAAHYTMGGVLTDLVGRSTVPGLFVVGEASSTGVHGANRLASNSLLEGLVFGARAAHAALAYADTAHPAHGEFAEWQLTKAVASLTRTAEQFAPHTVCASVSAAVADTAVAEDQVTDPQPGEPSHSSSAQPSVAQHRELSEAISADLGIERDAQGIARVRGLAERTPGQLGELVSMIAQSAAARTESRGAQLRSDFTHTDASLAHRLVWQANAAQAAEPTHSSTDVSSATPTRSSSSC